MGLLSLKKAKYSLHEIHWAFTCCTGPGHKNVWCCSRWVYPQVAPQLRQLATSGYGLHFGMHYITLCRKECVMFRVAFVCHVRRLRPDIQVELAQMGQSERLA